jgi:hypothetical protein
MVDGMAFGNQLFLADLPLLRSMQDRQNMHLVVLDPIDR